MHTFLAVVSGAFIALPALADTRPVFSVSTVAQGAQWIVVGEVIEAKSGTCTVPDWDWGETVELTVRATEVWKGPARDVVQFRMLRRDWNSDDFGLGRLVVVAFIHMAVPCENVTYPQGVLPVVSSIVHSGTLTGELGTQPINDLREKFQAALFNLR